jgi:L-asparaginase II
MTRFDHAFAPVAVSTRSGFDESLFFGAGVVVDVEGAIACALGDPHVDVYARSSLKPLQASAMTELGLALPDHLLAIVCASHDGAPIHLEAVRRLLDLFDLDIADLQNTPSMPLDDTARAAAEQAGAAPSSLQQNCSGKHAGMLATCRINGWPLDEYLAPDHPLQLSITSTIERLAGPIAHIGVDGCGAPAHAFELLDLARAFSSIVRSESGVASAMTSRPELVGGPTRDVTMWMRAVPGLMLKDGADGVMAGALPDGSAFALKIGDGSDVARRVVTAEALRELGVDVDRVAAETVTATRADVLGHGDVVGHVEALPWARWNS